MKTEKIDVYNVIEFKIDNWIMNSQHERKKAQVFYIMIIRFETHFLFLKYEISTIQWYTERTSAIQQYKNMIQTQII